MSRSEPVSIPPEGSVLFIVETEGDLDIGADIKIHKKQQFQLQNHR